MLTFNPQLSLLDSSASIPRGSKLPILNFRLSVIIPFALSFQLSTSEFQLSIYFKMNLVVNVTINVIKYIQPF